MDARVEVTDSLERSHPWECNSRAVSSKFLALYGIQRLIKRDKMSLLPLVGRLNPVRMVSFNLSFSAFHFNIIMPFGLLFLRSGFFPLAVPYNLHVFIIPHAFNTSFLSYLSALRIICYVLLPSLNNISFLSSSFFLSCMFPYSLQHSLLKYSSVCVLYRSYVATVN
jgi:hypothetical protein